MNTGFHPRHINRATFGFLHCSRDASGETVFVRMRIDKLKSSIISSAYVDIVQQSVHKTFGHLGDLIFRFDFYGGFKAILTDGELATQSREGSS